MSFYLEQVKRAIEATAFHSASSFSWFGKESPRLAPRVRRGMTPRAMRNYLLYHLQAQLYSDFYVRGGAVRRLWSGDSGAADPAAFARSLSAANTGRGCLENGWEVLTESQGHVVVRRGGLTLWVRPEECSIDGSGAALQLPKELLNISPGYYMVLGDRGDAAGRPELVLRVYWNLRAEGAASFVNCATARLNAARLFFRLKVLADPSAYTRCDAAVIYLHRQDYAQAAPILNIVRYSVVAHLNAATPAFTKTLAPGVGLAEDPGETESFGQHRCRLLADGMIRAYEQKVRSLDQRLEAVRDRWTEEGLSLERPYLCPNSTDIYPC